MNVPPGRPAFTYTEIGATRGELPPGYHHLRLRREVGRGAADFHRLGEAVLGYRMQRGLGILRDTSRPAAEPDAEVTVRLGIGPFGVRAPCRVVYVLREPDRIGFAYGTLPGHPECGEELFAVEYDRETETVFGVVTAFSRPAVRLTRLAGPLTVPVQWVIARCYLVVLRRTPRGG